MNDKAMHNLSYGLFVLSAKENAKDNGCIVNTVIQVTTDPNRIAVAVNKQNYTHGMIERTGEFNVSIMSESSDFETFKHWGFQSGADVDKTSGLSLNRTKNGIVYISDNCNAVISAKVVSQTDLGTHTLFIADVTDAEVLSEESSATYAFYHKNIKTAPPKSTQTKGYVCTVCGYVYEGENLPDDFICPWCKHPASDFEPIE